MEANRLIIGFKFLFEQLGEAIFAANSFIRRRPKSEDKFVPLKNYIIPFIIEEAYKMHYYRGWKNSKRDGMYLRDACLSAQDRYRVYLEYFGIKISEDNVHNANYISYIISIVKWEDLLCTIPIFWI